MKRAERKENTLLQKRQDTTRHWNSTRKNTIQITSSAVVLRVIHRN